jgi:hypothetical protein
MDAQSENYSTPKQRGENAHLEYGWSNDLQEQIVQFNFQLTRCTNLKRQNLSERLESILEKIISNKYQIPRHQEFLITLYKLIGYTRDIICGKGEYSLAYMQIIIWYKFFPELAKYALKCFLDLGDGSHPYGSWKDVKYFCNECIAYGLNEDHPLIVYALDLIKKELIKDNSSLVAKWIPREKSKKFGWLFNKLAVSHFSQYLESAVTFDQKLKATLKAKAEYRRLISRLNVEIDTVQIKQCNQGWSKIDHSRTTSITMFKQKRAFLNLNKDETTCDRILCAEKLTEILNGKELNGKELNEKELNGKELNGKRIGLNDFAKQATKLLHQKGSQPELDILNSQWRSNKTDIMGPVIAMIDCGESMHCNDESNPFYAAIGLGCKIAESSILGKRILTFGKNPKWHNLDMCDTFTQMVESIVKDPQADGSDFEKALDLILDAIIEKKMDSESASGLILVILSDMQAKEYDNLCSFETLYDKIEDKYSDAGIEICGKPYKPPHIIFWNLRSTNGFPCLSDQKNVSMVSGFRPSTIMHRFCENGFQKTTPWFSLIQSMKKKRYQCLENKIKETLDFFEFSPV